MLVIVCLAAAMVWEIEICVYVCSLSVCVAESGLCGLEVIQAECHICIWSGLLYRVWGFCLLLSYRWW